MKQGTLNGVATFSDFSDKERDLLERLFIEERYPAGKVLIQEGRRSGAVRSPLYLLLEGEVRIYRERPNADSKDTTFAFEALVAPPSLFGIISLSTNRPPSANCVTTTKCTLAHLDRPAFDTLHRDHSALAARFELLMARQLVRDLRRLTNSIFSTFEGVDAENANPPEANLSHG